MSWRDRDPSIEVRPGPGERLWRVGLEGIPDRERFAARNAAQARYRAFRAYDDVMGDWRKHRNHRFLAFMRMVDYCQPEAR